MPKNSSKSSIAESSTDCYIVTFTNKESLGYNSFPHDVYKTREEAESVGLEKAAMELMDLTWGHHDPNFKYRIVKIEEWLYKIESFSADLDETWVGEGKLQIMPVSMKDFSEKEKKASAEFLNKLYREEGYHVYKK